MTRDHRRLAAIVSFDVSGYSRLMGLDESGTLAALKAHRCELIDRKIAEYGGRIVKTTGDGLLAEFPSAVDAVRCAVDVQGGMAERNQEVVAAERLDFRVGINVGDIIIDGEDIFGDGVNLAARLQEVANSGGICISQSVYENVRNRVAAQFADGGGRRLKNIDQEVRVWHWSAATVSGMAPATPGQVPLRVLDKPSIAVLPFANMSGDPEQEYFGDGIVEDITTGLSRFSSLFVIARNSSFTYKGKGIDVKQVGRELGVRYVLEGSVRKAGDRVRITGQLIEAATGGHLWAERYDGDLKDILMLQEDIARRIVGTIAPEIVLAEQLRIGRMPRQALRAYDMAMQSLALCRRGQHDRVMLERALDLARAAHNVDPTSAPACYALAEVLSELAEFANFGEDMAALLEEAAAVANTLHNLDPTNHVGYYLIGHAAIRRRQAGEALSNLRRAHELNPNDCRTLQYLGWAEFNMGLSSDAQEHAELALRLSPRDPQRYLSYWVLAFAAFVAGSPQAGVRWARQAIAENPAFIRGRGVLAACLAEAGELREAQAVVKSLLSDDPDYIRSRLAGESYSGVPEIGERFTLALRKAAGPLLAATNGGA